MMCFVESYLLRLPQIIGKGLVVITHVHNYFVCFVTYILNISKYFVIFFLSSSPDIQLGLVMQIFSAFYSATCALVVWLGSHGANRPAQDFADTWAPGLDLTQLLACTSSPGSFRIASSSPAGLWVC